MDTAQETTKPIKNEKLFSDLFFVVQGVFVTHKHLYVSMEGIFKCFSGWEGRPDKAF